MVMKLRRREMGPGLRNFLDGYQGLADRALRQDRTPVKLEWDI
jgi:hypothetical protein